MSEIMEQSTGSDDSSNPVSHVGTYSGRAIRSPVLVAGEANTNLISARKQGRRLTGAALRLGRQNLGFDRVRSNPDAEPVLPAAARMKDKCRTEARDARSGVPANARVHDAV